MWPMVCDVCGAEDGIQYQERIDHARADRVFDLKLSLQELSDRARKEEYSPDPTDGPEVKQHERMRAAAVAHDLWAKGLVNLFLCPACRDRLARADR